MKNLFALLLLILAAYCCVTAQPRPEPALGFNNTRLMDLLTDQSGRLIPEKVDVLKTIPENINKVARFPHGAAARTYDFDEPGYGDVTTGKRTENYIFEFIKLCKLFRWSVCVVFNVTPEYLDSEMIHWYTEKQYRQWYYIQSTDEVPDPMLKPQFQPIKILKESYNVLDEIDNMQSFSFEFVIAAPDPVSLTKIHI